MIGTFKLPQSETYVDRVAHRFILRVITDSGVTYDEPNLKAILTDLNNDSLLSSASLVLAPSSYKATKLYSALPESGVGDPMNSAPSDPSIIEYGHLSEGAPSKNEYGLFIINTKPNHRRIAMIYQKLIRTILVS